MDLNSISTISEHENIVPGADVNEQIGQKRDSAGDCYVDHRYKISNEEKEGIFRFAVACGLLMVNAHFEKKDKHLLTFARNTGSKVDFSVLRRSDLENAPGLKG